MFKPTACPYGGVFSEHETGSEYKQDSGNGVYLVDLVRMLKSGFAQKWTKGTWRACCGPCGPMVWANSLGRHRKSARLCGVRQWEP